MFEGVVNSRFLQIVDLHGGKVDDIFQAMLTELERKRLPIEKLIGMATDGASVMKGERGEEWGNHQNEE